MTSFRSDEPAPCSPTNNENCPIETSSPQAPAPRNHYRFICNICFDPVHEPVVTQCGHLYCWPCLYKWLEPGMLLGERLTSLQVDESRRVCPVCKAPCSVPTVVPIYALVDQSPSTPAASTKSMNDNDNDNDTFPGKLPSGLRSRIPARPTQPRTISEPSSRPSPTRHMGGLARFYSEVPPLHHFHSTNHELQDPDATEYLSRILLMLGSFVVLCLLLF